VTAPVALLVNPSAGRVRSGRLVDEVEAVLGRAGTVRRVTGRDPADAARQLQLAVDAGAEAVVALGGDGTVNVALAAVAGTDVPLGVVPAGTGNDLAAALGLPGRDPVVAAGLVADRLVAGEARPMDAVRCGDRWYATVLCSGFDSRVSDRVNRMRWPHGQARYPLAVVAELGSFRPLTFTLTVDGGRTQPLDATMVAVGNTRSYGAGMRICPTADPFDGLLDVTVVGAVGTVELLRTFPKVFKGTHVAHPAVTTLRAKRLVVDAPGITAYADGEPLAPLPVEAECVPGAVRILA
jgi:diacylglycerol kinase (ATP)